VYLAHEQGLLHQPELNRFQYWALLYWIGMQRRMSREDRDAMLEIQTYNLFPERWEQLYSGQVFSVMAPPKVDEEEDVTDPEEIIRFFDNPENTMVMSGADVPDTDLATGGDEEWGEWV